MSSVSLGVRQRLHRTTETRQLDSRPRHVGGKVVEFVARRTAVGDVEDRCRAYGEDFKRGYPDEGEFGVEDGLVSVPFLAPCLVVVVTVV